VNALVPVDLTELESILIGPDGLIRAASYEVLKKFPQNDISYFCWKHAIYQIPTTELIEWLRNRINGRRAVEIGSGNGSVGTALGVPITDTRMQERDDIKARYEMLNQPVIKYHPNTVLLDGNSAVREMKPQVVVACWVTQLWHPGVEDGNMWGVNETDICLAVEEYIHVGNAGTHARKEVLKMFNFEQHQFEWLLSRSMDKDANCIYVYRNPKINIRNNPTP